MDNGNVIKNNKKEQKLKTNKIWIQKQNIIPEGMDDKMSLDKKLMKKYVSLLLEEEKMDKNKIKINKLKNKEDKRSFSSKIIEGISPKSQSILIKIGKHIKKIKKSISDITKMNGLYLEQNTRNTFQNDNKDNINSTFSIRKKNSMKNIQLDTLLNKENLLKKLGINQKDKNDKDNPDNKIINHLSDNDDIYGERHKRDDFRKNFMFVNDNYRRQLNCAFLKYNPISHLENLKILVQAVPSIRKDISKINEEVEEDIKWKCDSFHFRKKYLNFISKYPRSNSVEPQGVSPKSPQMKMSNFPKIGKNNYMKDKKILSPQYSKVKTISLFEKRRARGDIQKINLQKEQKIEEINQILNATNEINNFIKPENISDKIDLCKTDYSQRMYYLKKEEMKNKNKILKKDYFKNDQNKVVEKIGDIFLYQIARNSKEKEKQLKDKIKIEHNEFNKKVKDGKKSIMVQLREILKLNINNNQGH